MTGIIIQARTGSTRLPNKMIIPFFKKKGILEILLTRLKGEDIKLPLILATTSNPFDDLIEEIGVKQKIEVFRGSEFNVLGRFISAAEQYGFDKIIRICADNPFLDMNSLKKQIIEFDNYDNDYWCFSLSDKTPTIKTHYGFWAEGVKLAALKKIKKSTNEKIFQEHVTNFIYENPIFFDIHYETIDINIEREQNIRLTIDTKDDFKLAQYIFNNMFQKNITINISNIIKFIKESPELIKIMEREIIKNKK